jgi:hypothetical protein
VRAARTSRVRRFTGSGSSGRTTASVGGLTVSAYGISSSGARGRHQAALTVPQFSVGAVSEGAARQHVSRGPRVHAGTVEWADGLPAKPPSAAGCTRPQVNLEARGAPPAQLHLSDARRASRPAWRRGVPRGPAHLHCLAATVSATLGPTGAPGFAGAGSPQSRGARILRRAVSGDDGNARVSTQSLGQCRRRTVRQQINDTVLLQIDQDGAVGAPFAQSPVIDAEHPRLSMRRQRYPMHQSQERVGTGRHGQRLPGAPLRLLRRPSCLRRTAHWPVAGSVGLAGEALGADAPRRCGERMLDCSGAVVAEEGREASRHVRHCHSSPRLIRASAPAARSWACGSPRGRGPASASTA